MDRLHTVPDTAGLIVRLTLEELGTPWEVRLVDAKGGGLAAPAFRALNPQGLVPVLDTDTGPVFETGAILLSLADRYPGLAPAPGAPGRGAFLSWLFFTSNTLHPDLARLFHPARHVGPDPGVQDDFRDIGSARIRRHFALLDTVAATHPGWLDPAAPSVLCWYLAVMIRWAGLLSAEGDDWFDLAAHPALSALAAALETRPAARHAAAAEGLGPTPFTAPA